MRSHKQFKTIFALGLLVLGGTSGYALNNAFDSRGPDPQERTLILGGGGGLPGAGPLYRQPVDVTYDYNKGNFSATGTMYRRGYDQGHTGPVFIGQGPSGSTLDRDMLTGRTAFYLPDQTTPYATGYRAPLSAQGYWHVPEGGGFVERNMVTGRTFYANPNSDMIAYGRRIPTTPTVFYVRDIDGSIKAYTYDWGTGTSTPITLPNSGG